MNESIRQIEYGSKTITFSLSFSNRKTLGIQVHPDGSVMVIAPENSNESAILNKVRSKTSWIIRRQLEFQNFRPFTPPRSFVNGESHLYLGRQYILCNVLSDTEKIKISAGKLHIHSRNLQPKHLEAILLKWYKLRAQSVFGELLLSSFEKFSNYKIPYPEIQIRRMNKRWGSCSPAGKITLNPELIKAPKGSIEYVIIHELCHLVHPNHTIAFLNLQEKMMPDWKKWKSRLEYCLA
ncbi:MAG TPA: SprT family zinc-dependent metalloprotease [Bacteroidales bacterium]|nr:SprT family zinc-dependent metalloprotease [Bacteroidales bacterium]